MGKGFSGKRAKALAAHVSRWDADADQSWLGWVDPTFDLGRPVQVLVKRRQHKGKLKHSYYATTLSFPSKRAFMERYNQRGGAEIEQFRNDKSGLHLSARRKQSFTAQKALILLTDLAHNLLDFQRHNERHSVHLAGHSPLVQPMISLELCHPLAAWHPVRS